MDLVLENATSGSWTVVRVEGELDLHTSPQLRDHVLALIGESPPNVVLDLSAVGFMDSSSLGMLVTCLKRVRERDGRFSHEGALPDRARSRLRGRAVDGRPPRELTRRRHRLLSF
jgi:anti-sigma B factor antagonist